MKENKISDAEAIAKIMRALHLSANGLVHCSMMGYAQTALITRNEIAALCDKLVALATIKEEQKNAMSDIKKHFGYC